VGCQAWRVSRRRSPASRSPRRHRDGTAYWVYRVRWKDPVTGRRLVETFPATAAGAQDAKDFKAALRLAKRRGQTHELDRGRELLDEFAKRWLTDWAAANLTRRTLQDYVGVFDRHLRPRVGHLQLRLITPRVVDKLRADLEQAGVGAPTIRKALAILQAILREAVVWGELTSNPVRSVKKPTARRRRKVTALTVDQVEQLLAALQAIDPASATLAELMAYSGARPQDALAVTFGDVGRRVIRYHRKNLNGTIVDGAKTGEEKDRSVELLPHLRRDLLHFRAARAGATPESLIVARSDGGAWTETDYRNWTKRAPRGKRRADGSRTGKPGAFHQAAVAVGLGHITPYDLRHTFASLRLAEQRLSQKEIADEMGHSLQMLSDTYSHVIADLKGAGPVDPDALIAKARGEEPAQEAM
jgi:integrase